MKPVLRPEEKHIYVEKNTVDATCPSCGGTHILGYPVLSEGGWWDVKKCQDCLHSLERTRGGLFGTFETLTNDL